MGHSITEIMAELAVPKTTVWHHIKNVKVLPKYTSILKAKQGGSLARSLRDWEQARQEAKRLIYTFGKNEKIIVAATLYWAEGSKSDFSLSNTDPYLIKTFIDCLREFGIAKEQLAISVRIYEDLNKNACCLFWSKVAGIKRAEIKSVNILSGKKKGKLKYGMCRVRVVKGGYLLKLICAIIEQLKNAPIAQADRALDS